jgi:hypothetical protein
VPLGPVQKQKILRPAQSCVHVHVHGYLARPSPRGQPSTLACVRAPSRRICQLESLADRWLSRRPFPLVSFPSLSHSGVSFIVHSRFLLFKLWCGLSPRILKAKLCMLSLCLLYAPSCQFFTIRGAYQSSSYTTSCTYNKHSFRPLAPVLSPSVLSSKPICAASLIETLLFTIIRTDSPIESPLFESTPSVCRFFGPLQLCNLTLLSKHKTFDSKRRLDSTPWRFHQRGRKGLRRLQLN